MEDVVLCGVGSLTMVNSIHVCDMLYNLSEAAVCRLVSLYSYVQQQCAERSHDVDASTGG